MTFAETRNKWDKGVVRHLRIDPSAPLDSAYAIRVERNGGLSAPGGSVDIVYTLVIHPCHAAHAEKLRSQLEASPMIGGPFSPPRDDRAGDVVGDRFLITGGPVAIQGLDGCTDMRCTRLISRETGEDVGCAGYHCPHCLERTGMTGHKCARQPL